MLIRVLKSKLHLATVTHAELLYHGSITIDRDLMDAVGLIPFEQVLIANSATGLRGETYVIEGERGSGVIQMNGALARMALPGDRIIILAFAFTEESELRSVAPKIAILDESNKIIEKRIGDRLLAE